MPIPLLGAAPAVGTIITAALGAVVAKVFEFAYKFLAYKVAKRIAIGTGAVLVAAGLTLSMAQGIKAALLAVRVVAPPMLAQVTYWLPPSLNLQISCLITVRLIHFVWQWSMKNLGRYTQVTY